MIKPYGPYDFMPPIRTFSLTSESLANGEQLAREQVSGILGAGGLDISPQLSWSGFPEEIPAFNIRNEFEVNVIGPLLLTQGIAKQMVKRGAGRIVWVSSREGLNVNPFTGIYSASKQAVEAIAETMAYELQEFGIEVATINPGPFLTGFNDRGFE